MYNELFGFDFMVDKDGRVYLIEVNTNPCLECECGVLEKVIPDVIESTLKLTIDTIF